MLKHVFGKLQSLANNLPIANMVCHNQNQPSVNHIASRICGLSYIAMTSA